MAPIRIARIHKKFSVRLVRNFTLFDQSRRLDFFMRSVSPGSEDPVTEQKKETASSQDSLTAAAPAEVLDADQLSAMLGKVSVAAPDPNFPFNQLMFETGYPSAVREPAAYVEAVVGEIKTYINAFTSELVKTNEKVKLNAPPISLPTNQYELARASYITNLREISLHFENKNKVFFGFKKLELSILADTKLSLPEIQKIAANFLRSFKFFLKTLKSIPSMESKISENLLDQVTSASQEVEKATTLGDIALCFSSVKDDLTNAGVEEAWNVLFITSSNYQSDYQLKRQNPSLIPTVAVPASAALAAAPFSAPASPSLNASTVTQSDILELMRKTSNSDYLTPAESQILANLSLSQLATLAKKDDFKVFNIGVDIVIRLRFNFKLTHVFQAPVMLLTEDGEILNPAKESLENYNNATSISELYFVVVKNDGTVTMADVFQKFYKKLFEDQIAPIVSEKLVLEAIQIQKFWPGKALGAFDIESYNQAGGCPFEEPIAAKPFLLTFSSALLKSSKNAFTFAIPGVVTKFKKTKVFNGRKEQFKDLSDFLTNYVTFGPQDNLSLALVVPTNKSNSPVPFVPVTNCSVIGFAGNARKSVKFRSTGKKSLPVEGSA
jgi:hypothetical protein